MRFCYADPPYLGCGNKYDHPGSMKWNSPDAHRLLLASLRDEFPDGWAVSLHVPSLPLYLEAAPEARLCVWVKPFASFKPGVTLAYTWEPVLICGGRKRARKQPTCRDHLSENITLKKGLTGAKPLRFNQWIMALLNWQQGDILVDMFPGTGIMDTALLLGEHDLGGPRRAKKSKSTWHSVSILE